MGNSEIFESNMEESFSFGESLVLTKFLVVPEGSGRVQRGNMKQGVCKIMRDQAVRAKNNAFISMQRLLLLR